MGPTEAAKRQELDLEASLDLKSQSMISLLTKYEPMLALMKEKFGKPLTDTSMDHVCSLVLQGSKLVMITPIEDFKNCAEGSIGDFLSNSGRTLTYLSSVHSQKHLKATQFLFNSYSLGY